MLPDWVQDLNDYWTWLEQAIDSSGGWLVYPHEYLAVEVIPDEDLGGPPLALNVEQHRLQFPDGSYLEFDYSVDENFSAIGYSFHYARPDHACVWRYDKHIGHEEEDGGDTHVHRGPDARREPHPEVDLGDVVDFLRADQDERSA